MDPIEAYIRNAAIQRNIDPDQAVRVARSEGLNSYVGDDGSSFGPFQLHYGGMAPGGNAVSGLGDEFTAATGLHASDPNTVHQQIDFSLDHAAQNGWGAWHGWKGDPWAGIKASYKPPMQAAMNERQPMPNNNTPVLFGGNPTPVGLLGGLARAIGVGSEDDLGRRLQNGAAGLMAVGTTGLPGGGMGAANFAAVANQPHYDVVTDALGNRYILDKRTGAITRPGMNQGSPNGMAPEGGVPSGQQQFKPSGDPAIDAVVNSPLGAVKGGETNIEQSIKDKQDLESAGELARQGQELVQRQLELAKSGQIVQGPGVMNWIKEHGAEALGQGNPFGVDLDKQNEFDQNNLKLGTLLGKDILNNARIAGPELKFLQMIHPTSEYTQGANINTLNALGNSFARMAKRAEIGRSYKALGPNYYKEVQDYEQQHPLYNSNATSSNSGPSRVTNTDDYNALSKGTQYLDPNGVLRTKQ